MIDMQYKCFIAVGLSADYADFFAKEKEHDSV
jgi:hypothetical protein